MAKYVSKGIHSCYMIEVNNLPFAGSYGFWTNKFLSAMTNEFNASYSEFKEDCSIADQSTSKRQLRRLMMVC